MSETFQPAEASRELAASTARAVELLETNAPEANAMAESGIALAERLGDRSALAWNRYVAASSRVNRGDYTGAEAGLREVLAQDSDVDARLKVLVLRGLLKCAFYTRDTDTALMRGMQALHLARECGDLAAEGLVHNDLGIVYGYLGDFEDALEHLLNGLRTVREGGGSKLASHLNNIGNVYLELSEFREALRFFTSARAEFREAGLWRGEAIASGNIGRAHTGLDEHEAAVDAFVEGLNLLERHGDVTYLASATARLGTALAAVGRTDEARRAFARALDLLDRSPHREFEDEILAALGVFHLDTRESHAAVEWLTRALASINSDEISKRVFELHRSLSAAYEEMGSLSEALLHFKEYHRVRQSASDRAMTVRIRGVMFQFDVEQARQREEMVRERNVELATANEELQALHAALEAQNSELHRLSVEDPLTGLYNRRHLDYQLSVEISRAKRYRRPLCAALCDLDHFKLINDRYSHGVGDEVLRRVAIVLRQTARVTDAVGRYGGEEFLLLLPETDLEGAHRFCDRVREGLAAHPWHELHEDLRVTFSMGVSELAAGGDAISLLSTADARLYEAKRNGRDRVVSGPMDLLNHPFPSG